MDVIGLGFDTTDIPRVADVFDRYGERFLRRIFTDGEIAYCMRHRNPVPHLAGRFAAKEAGMKALGTGHSRGVLVIDWLLLVALLMIIFPFSKLLHAPGVFFSPTRNQADNPREKRHLAPWAAELEAKN